MKKLIFFILFSVAVSAQPNYHIIAPRTSLTGLRIKPPQLTEDIAIAVFTNNLISSSDEIDTTTKTTPVYVWRLRDEETKPCILKVLDTKILPALQIFILPKDKVKPYDTLMFEYRPWYDITLNIEDVGSKVVLSGEDLTPYAPGSVVLCSDDEDSESTIASSHIRLIKE